MSKSFWLTTGKAVADPEFAAQLLLLRRVVSGGPANDPKDLADLRAAVNAMVSPYIGNDYLVYLNRCLYTQSPHGLGDDIVDIFSPNGLLGKLTAAITTALSAPGLDPDAVNQRDFQIFLGYLCIDDKAAEMWRGQIVDDLLPANIVNGPLDVQLDNFESEMAAVLLDLSTSDLLAAVTQYMWKIIDPPGGVSLTACSPATQGDTAVAFKVATSHDLQRIVMDVKEVRDSLESQEILMAERGKLDAIVLRYESVMPLIPA